MSDPIDKVVEIRVHGVSGTPPRAMLRTDPEPIPPAESGRAETIELYEPPSRDTNVDGIPLEVKAYQWGGLTSGKKRHALWLLLLPFTLINVAGWMLPRPEPSAGEAEKGAERGTFSDRVPQMLAALLRIAGLGLTGVLTLFGAVVTLDLMVYKCSFGQLACNIVPNVDGGSTGLLLAIGALVPVIIISLLAAFVAAERTMKSIANELQPEGEPAPDDPAQALSITSPRLWVTHPLSLHLGYVNVALALTVSAALLVTARGGLLEQTAWQIASDPAGITSHFLLPLIVIGAVVVSTLRVHRTWFRPIALFTLVAATTHFFAIAWWVAADSSIEAGVDRHIAADGLNQVPGLQPMAVVIVGLLAAVSLLVFLTARPISGWGRAATPTLLVVLAALVGAAFGAGAALALEGALSVGDLAVTGFPGLDWVAVGFLIVFLVTVGLVLIALNVKWRKEGDAFTQLFRAMSDVAGALRGLLAWPILVGISGGGVFIAMFAIEDEIPPVGEVDWLRPEWLVSGLAIAVAGVAVLAVARYAIANRTRRTVILVGLVLAAAASWFVVTGRFPEVSALGITLSFRGLVAIATSVTVLVPTSLILARMVAGFRDRETRRGVGMLWDLGGFWPRWYHPFAAPYYTAIAVPDLQRLVKDELSDDAERKIVIVAAHSQGSVIAKSALLTLDLEPDERERLALLTYGSPIRQLYVQLFSGHFTENTTKALQSAFTGATGVRWRNLFRETDPIGGPVALESVDVGPLVDADNVGHSGYEGEPCYEFIRRELVRLVVPGTSVPGDETPCELTPRESVTQAAAD